LKLYTRVPDNGLVIYCGTILTDDGKEKRVNIDFEPFKPINTSLYLCDNKFHTEVSTHLLPPFHYRLMLIPSSLLNSY
jgi:peptide chain release factor subunit 1